jgi:hypothetical protein
LAKVRAVTAAKITAQVNEELAARRRQTGRPIASKLILGVHAFALLEAIQELDCMPNEPMSFLESKCIFRPRSAEAKELLAAHAAANPDILSFDERLNAYLTPSLAENDFINDLERAAAELVRKVRFSLSQRKFEELFGIADDILRNEIVGVLGRAVGSPGSSDARAICALIGGALIVMGRDPEPEPARTGAEG